MASATLAKHKDSAETVNIAPDGDVVFVVGATKIRLRVYSLFVRNASPVLFSMLGPNFKEGQQLGKTGSAEISLPEDNAKAMETVFNVIHSRNDQVHQSPSPEELLQIAIACDKYNCSVSLEFAIGAWLSRSCATFESESLWALAMAACLFRRAETFAETTHALAFNHAGPYIDLTRKHDKVVDATMLLRTAVMLEEVRSKLRTDLLVIELRGYWQRGSNFNTELSNIGNNTVSSTLEAVSQDRKLHQATLSDPYLKRRFNPIHGRPRVSTAQDSSSIADQFKKKNENAGRLCLWCVRTGEEHGRH